MEVKGYQITWVFLKRVEVKGEAVYDAVLVLRICKKEVEEFRVVADKHFVLKWLHLERYREFYGSHDRVVKIRFTISSRALPKRQFEY